MCGSSLTECPVCFTEVNTTCSLICGHSFCNACVKEWYSKGDAGRTCPMCRKPLYFKGLFKKQAKWDEEYYQNELSQVFADFFDSILDEETFKILVTNGKYPRWAAFLLMNQIHEFERRFNKLKEWFSVEDLEYELDDSYESTPFESIPRFPRKRSRRLPKYIFKNIQILGVCLK